MSRPPSNISKWIQGRIQDFLKLTCVGSRLFFGQFVTPHPKKPRETRNLGRGASRWPVNELRGTPSAGGLSQRILKEPQNEQNPCQRPLLHHDHTPSFPTNWLSLENASLIFQMCVYNYIIISHKNWTISVSHSCTSLTLQTGVCY